MMKKIKLKNLGVYMLLAQREWVWKVDNQAGGDQKTRWWGNSIFCGWEDDLINFGSESINKMLEKLGLKDGESIDHPWINKALERAQQKVEAKILI